MKGILCPLMLMPSSRRPSPCVALMPAKIFPAAEKRLIEIWDYTLNAWGEDQADKYLRRLVLAIHSLPSQKSLWRRFAQKGLSGIFFVRHEHHFIFFRELSTGEIGVITVLHEKMNIPARIREVGSHSEFDED